MTERGLPHVDGANACPFVAFEDDRDERSDRPDHRHRCYAEIPPAPRAIAHQEAYCLSSAFAVCPTFQDWAQREAARTRREGEAKAAAAAAAAASGRPDEADDVEAGAAGSAAREVADERGAPGRDAASPQLADEWRGGGRRPAQDDEPMPPPPRRNPPRDWAAPPPWAGGAAAGAAGGAAGGAAAGAAAGMGAGAGGIGHDQDPDSPRFLADREEGRGLAGSAADRLAAGERIEPARPTAPRHATPIQQATPMRGARPADRPRTDEDEELASLVRGTRRDRPDEDTDRYRADAGHGAGDGRRRPNGRSVDDAPAWEEPRRYEAYPTIKSRTASPGLPRLGIMVAALALAALVLFIGPGLLGFIGSNQGGGDPEASPSPTVVAETASPAPSVAPEPTQQVYVIKSGDTLSKVADRFGITLDQLLDANKETIKNPDRIVVGDEIIIPAPSEPPG